jgi:HSP20 family protein
MTMNNLTRWDPMREMMSMRNNIDRLFENFFDTQPAGRQLSSWVLPLDVAENEEDFVVKATIPGVDPNNLEITYNNHTLSIKGEVEEDKKIDESRYHLRERRFGRFERSIYLPTEVEADKIEANYEAGVLSLRLPKSEEVKPKRISIKSGSRDKMLEGQFQKNDKS